MKTDRADAPAPHLAATLGRLLVSTARRVRRVVRGDRRFRGAFVSREEALAHVKRGALAGYNHAAVVDVTFESMSKLVLWDYPVLYWLRRVAPTRLLDAGGHMGTKYRAFKDHLSLPSDFSWIVYDLPEIVAAGRARSVSHGTTAVQFVDSLSVVPEVDVLLGSGLLQYLDVPLERFLAQLASRPAHLILNKVAVREGPTVVMLEQIGPAEVPYQVRDRAQFFSSLTQLGYDVVDSWTIPELSHRIPGNPTVRSTSIGLYARLRSEGSS